MCGFKDSVVSLCNWHLVITLHALANFALPRASFLIVYREIFVYFIFALLTHVARRQIKNLANSNVSTYVLLITIES